MLAGVSTFCFFASYTVTLLLEISRLFFRAPIRLGVMLAFAVAGLFAHSVFLWLQIREELATGAVLASWFDWCIMAAWVLAVAYLWLTLSRPQIAVGIFILPLVLGLIGLAVVLPSTPFPRQESLNVWRTVHAISLLFGTVGVTLGFATGVMYLVQSYRLKQKLPPRQGLKLPSLEWLQRFNRESLFVSTFLLAVGLLSGIVMNLTKHVNDSVPWTDLGVIFSGVLFLGLATASVFEACYRPARQGRKIAYLTLANFIFLGLALGFVLLGEHSSPRPQNGSARMDAARSAGAQP